jgi:hypothetical protein
LDLKKKNLLFRNLWKVSTRPTSASDFFHVLCLCIGKKHVLSKKIFKIFGVKPILSLIYFKYAEFENGKFFSEVFKMAGIFKMAEKRVFPQFSEF